MEKNGFCKACGLRLNVSCAVEDKLGELAWRSGKAIRRKADIYEYIPRVLHAAAYGAVGNSGIPRCEIAVYSRFLYAKSGAINAAGGFGNLPEAANGILFVAGKVPKRIGNLPESFGRVTKNSGETPESAGDIPEGVMNVPGGEIRA
ncbi:hypothetical protein HC024_03310 [Methylococcaceae bacterium WWC4]|nr:hypothetical protein [Methylococcaceae bacterium WWC4]